VVEVMTVVNARDCLVLEYLRRRRNGQWTSVQSSQFHYVTPVTRTTSGDGSLLASQSPWQRYDPTSGVHQSRRVNVFYVVLLIISRELFDRRDSRHLLRFIFIELY
jgi:hypothetical protein